METFLIPSEHTQRGMLTIHNYYWSVTVLGYLLFSIRV